MVGGDSLFLALKQIFPEKKFWINDINKDLFLFWRVLQAKSSYDSEIKDSLYKFFITF